MTKTTAMAYAFALSSLIIKTGCDNDESTSPEDGGEFIATVQDFAGYQSWQKLDLAIGESNPALMGAHMSEDEGYSRRIYVAPSSSRMNEASDYPEGTILVKETFTWDPESGEKIFASMGGILAMTKRGADFNPMGAGWEWLELSNDPSEIIERGGSEMMDGMCNSCHNMAGMQTGGSDFVFPHPTELEVTDAYFADYETWVVIDETSQTHSLLGGAHHGYDSTAVRRTFKRQYLSNPDTDEQGYPVGTAIIKEVENASGVIEISAMVKRGGDFNPDHGTWEWFMLDPATQNITDRGADLLNGMCNGCHESGSDPQWGRDYVFKHANDPFNH